MTRSGLIKLILSLLVASLIIPVTEASDKSSASASKSAKLGSSEDRGPKSTDYGSAGAQPEGGQLGRALERKEYCYYDNFEARCAQDEIIVIKSALYGRMRFGRCVKVNFGYIGCYTDVTDLLDRNCSGRRVCTVAVIEPTFNGLKPCNMELKSYLEVHYECLKVPDYTEQFCEVTVDRLRSLAITQYVVERCGSSLDPWRIKVFPGQRINVTLLRLPSHLSPPLTKISPPSSGSRAMDSMNPHKEARAEEYRSQRPLVGEGVVQLGRLVEPLTAKSTDLSEQVDFSEGSLRVRESHVLTTTSHVLEVSLNTGSISTSAFQKGAAVSGVVPVTPDVSYLLIFTVIGCADLEVGPHMWIRYSQDRGMAEIGCKNSEEQMNEGRGDRKSGGAGGQGEKSRESEGVGKMRRVQTWKLFCSDKEWSGSAQRNCSNTAVSIMADINGEDPNFLRLSSVLVALIVTGVSGTISLCVLVTGLLIFKRFRTSPKCSGSSHKSALRNKLLDPPSKLTSSSHLDHHLDPLYDTQLHHLHYHHHHPYSFSHQHHDDMMTSLQPDCVHSALCPHSADLTLNMDDNSTHTTSGGATDTYASSMGSLRPAKRNYGVHVGSGMDTWAGHHTLTYEDKDPGDPGLFILDDSVCLDQLTNCKNVLDGKTQDLTSKLLGREKDSTGSCGGKKGKKINAKEYEIDKSSQSADKNFELNTLDITKQLNNRL